jgi:hypothetical protein
MKLNFTLYHGTKSEFADSIISKKKFENSIDNCLFLGNGVYFYDSHINALYYNIGRYRELNQKIPTSEELNESYKVLSANIIVQNHEILDMNKYEVKYSYIYIFKKIINRLEKIKGYDLEKYKDGFILNFLQEQSEFLKGYKVIKNIYNKRITKNSLFISRIAFDVKQTYYCVIDNDCITNIKVDNNNCDEEYNVIEKIYNLCK